MTTINGSDSHLSISKCTIAGGVQVFDQELDPHPRDDQERAVDDGRIAADERQQLPDDDADGDDAEQPAGQHDPELPRHRHGYENRVDRERDVDQLDFDDRAP